MQYKNFTNRADLLEAAAHSIRMQEKAGIEPVYKNAHGVIICKLSDAPLNAVYHYNFPLAIIEGKPVFEGDELWCKDGCKHKIMFLDEDGILMETSSVGFTPGFLSWNPPKPETVKIEIPTRTAEFYADYHNTIGEACRKALEMRDV